MAVLHPSIKDDDEDTFYFGQDKYKIPQERSVFQV